MMRRLQFQMVADTRFGKDMEDIEQWDKQLTEQLGSNPSIELDSCPVNKYIFRDSEPCISYRKTNYITKHDRRITWNQIYGIVNRIKVTIFDFV